MANQPPSKTAPKTPQQWAREAELVVPYSLEELFQQAMEAAASDMRERCAQVHDEIAEALLAENDGARMHFFDISNAKSLAKTIRALPLTQPADKGDK